jgi:hypothetical protein
MLRVALVGVLALAAGIVPASLAAMRSATPHTTARQAERNLLRAQHMLARWRAGLTSPATGLVKPNTTAQCRGRGRGVAHRKGASRAFFSFHCVLRNHGHTVSVLYYALHGNGFEVRHRKVVHA